jgi:RNA polymerase sigma factor (sigma-70 family)
MLQPERRLPSLLKRVQREEPGAAEEFVARYGRHILRTVRRYLHPKLRARFDSQDFVQAVWTSFFADVGHFENNFQMGDIAAYLAIIARNKTVEEMRGHLWTRKRRLGREVNWHGLAETSSTYLVAGPTPSQVAVVEETWRHLTDGRSNQSVTVFEMRRHGASHRQIAKSLGIARKTVQQIIDRAERRLADNAQFGQAQFGQRADGADG